MSSQTGERGFLTHNYGGMGRIEFSSSKILKINADF